MAEKQDPSNSTSETPGEPSDLDIAAERALSNALGGLSPREALIANSRAEDADVEARETARIRNRENALRLLAMLEKSGAASSGDSD